MESVKFEYNGQIYETFSLDKKLKKLKITKDDIKIIKEDKIQTDDKRDIKHYHFNNILTGESITSIYDNLENLKHIININDYVLRIE